MTRGGAPSSQIGLFSTQISEQITRLRALVDDGGNLSPSNDVVALKRAVMATRLLAGSARILRLDSLQQFLDQLLSWLQTLEGRGHPPTATEAMILESVVDLEESLMDTLDSSEGGSADLSAYDDDLSELLAMMARHATAPMGEEPEPSPEETPTPVPSPTPSPTATRREAALADALGALISQLEQFHEESAVLSVEGRDGLAVLADRLVGLVGSLSPTDPAHGSEDESFGPAPAGFLVDEEATAGKWPRGDELLDPLARHLEERGQRMGLDTHFMVSGDSTQLAVGLHDVVGQILTHLLDDICDRFQQALYAEEDLVASPRIYLDITTNRGRLEFVLRDNAPRLDGRAAMMDVDHLSFYRGLRRARPLIQQLAGMIRVESGTSSDRRFQLILPAGVKRQAYRLVDLGGARMAVPWVSVDSDLLASSLRMEVDHSGESFDWEGHHVAVVDLGSFLGAVTSRDADDSRVLLLGAVERRIGLLCASIGEIVESKTLGDVAPEWGLVAAGAIEVGSEWVPVLDVARVMSLRLRNTGASDLSGALHDPYLDSYVPEVARTPTPTPAPTPKSASATTCLQVLLVNQSEFRRRDLARTLEDLGHMVTTARDLDGVVHHADSQRFDLVVTDLRLGQRGEDRLHSLRERLPALPVVLTSAVAREQAEELAVKVGASHCWLEPYRKADLVGILRELP